MYIYIYLKIRDRYVINSNFESKCNPLNNFCCDGFQFDKFINLEQETMHYVFFDERKLDVFKKGFNKQTQEFDMIFYNITLVDFQLMKIIILFVALLGIITTVNPPIYDYPFSIFFDETFIKDSTAYKVNGQTFYDPRNNRQRVDRTNGRYDTICGTILPNVTTPCQQYTVNNKRWVVFPNRSSCCFCCDSAHGCGILKPNWLEDAVYKGQDKIIDTLYDKWSKDGVVGYNYLWTTTNEAQIPRRLDEAGTHITDYNIFSFHNQTIPFPESVFALPAYCKVDTPTNCPLESTCAKFRLRATQ